jgi:hypothetical protein
MSGSASGCSCAPAFKKPRLIRHSAAIAAIARAGSSNEKALILKPVATGVYYTMR